EFVSAALNHSLLEKKDLLQQAFDHFDLDKDGCISKTELSMVIRSSGRHSEAALAHLLASVHFDAEGKV
ncbi:calcium-dependent protein kinase 31, partial [Haematococcus lacustris]